MYLCRHQCQSCDNADGVWLHNGSVTVQLAVWPVHVPPSWFWPRMLVTTPCRCVCGTLTMGFSLGMHKPSACTSVDGASGRLSSQCSLTNECIEFILAQYMAIVSVYQGSTLVDPSGTNINEILHIMCDRHPLNCHSTCMYLYFRHRSSMSSRLVQPWCMRWLGSWHISHVLLHVAGFVQLR